jgi:large subunit ribosomal protein L21
MYVIVDIAGQQFKVEKDNQIFVHRLAGAEGDTVEFNKVMLVEDGDNVTVGKPLVEGASVSAKILSHVRGDKVIIFKKKRRKSYQLQKGHRQDFSKVQIENISLNA